MDAEFEQAAAPVDVFGTVEPNSRAGPGHIRDVVEGSPPSSPLFTPAARRSGSRRAQSVDLSTQRGARQPSVPSPLGPARRKRGERDREGHERRREKDTLRAELDASAAVAPGLALDPRIASDVLALERRFAAASKGKSPAPRPPRTHTHRPRHSLPVTPNRADVLSTPNRANLNEPLSPLPEASTGDEPSTTVEPALPSSAVASVSPSPEPVTPRSGPSPIRVEKSAYASLLPSSEPEPVSSGADPVKRSKRASLTAMFGITRKKDKEAHATEKETDSDLSRMPSPPRPIVLRADTHRTSHTMLTTHTSATAGSDDHPHPYGYSGGGSPLSHSPTAIEPSAKTLARAAATRDQLAKRYAILYAGLGGSATDTGSTISTSFSSHSHPSSSKFVRGPGTNPLEVLRWRLSKPKPQLLEVERTDEVWEREVERRIRDYPLLHQPTLGESLPEATSLGWLPYLEPVFAEERGGAAADVGMGPGLAGESKKPMTAWYVLASFVEDYISARRNEGQPGDHHLAPKPMDTSPTPSHTKVTSDVRAQAIVNAARSAGLDVNEGARFGIIDRALRTRSRQGSVATEPAPLPVIAIGARARSRHSSIGLVGSASLGGGSIGMASEPPSPSHIPLSHSKFLSPSSSIEAKTRAGRSHSGASHRTNHSHTRSQSQARSLSGGNGNGSVDWGRMGHGALGDGKSMSPSSSKMNLANFIMGGAAVLGLNMRRRPPGTGIGREVVSGSENESARISSDVSPVPSDVDMRYYGRGGVSDGEGGRVKKRKKTWREETERVPLSDGAGSGSGERRDMKRRSWRQSTAVMVPVEVQPEQEREERERNSREAREKEKEYARKRVVVDDTHDTLMHIDERLRNFVDLATYLNSVHEQGHNVFGDMFMTIPSDVISALAPDPSEEDGSHSRTPTATSPLTPTQRTALSSEILSSFARHLEGEEKPIAVDMIGRSTLDANLPIRAFDVLHTLDHKLKDISNRIRSLRQICDDAEQERKEVKRFYEITAESVETTYPECTQIERLLSSLVTEDMPWLPSWLPLWVRHLLEIFSNQIQFLVENGLRIYGYMYHIVYIIVLLVSLVFKVIFMLGRFVRSIWWALAIAAISGVVYLMMYPPDGVPGQAEAESS